MSGYGYDRGDRVTVRHEMGVESGTVTGWTHTPDHPCLSIRWDDGTETTVPVSWVIARETVATVIRCAECGRITDDPDRWDPDAETGVVRCDECWYRAQGLSRWDPERQAWVPR